MRGFGGILALLLAASTACNSPVTSNNEWSMLAARMHGATTASSGVNPAAVSTADRAELLLAAEMVAPAVVGIVAEPEYGCAGKHTDHPPRCTGSPTAGTGISIAAPGIVLTAAHVVEHAERIWVVDSQNKQHVVDLVVVDERLDLAVLLVHSLDAPTIMVSPSSLNVGRPVVSITSNFSAGNRDHYRFGVTTQIGASLQNALNPSGLRSYRWLVESNTPLTQGDSGGPLLDAQGRLLGVNIAAAGAPGTNSHRGYAIPLDDANCARIQTLISWIRSVN